VLNLINIENGDLICYQVRKDEGCLKQQRKSKIGARGTQVS